MFRPTLAWSLVLSIALHAAVLVAAGGLPAAIRLERPKPVLLAVEVRRPPPPAASPAAPPLVLPPEPRRHPSAAKPASATLSGAARSSAMEQMSRELNYPQEAIERGLEGEALVLLFLDAAGNAVAARLEASSGHALLDEAALRAARTLRSLPDSAPREALLPVRFRLR